jgi:excisionase family DNA binding protein
MTERLLTRGEVAEFLGVPVKTVAAWAYTGRGPAFVRIGKHSRYDPADVRAWIERQRIDPEARR